MSGVETYVTWTQAQSMLLEHFCNSTIEFSWEENTVFASNFFEKCLAIQCILITYDILLFERGFENVSFTGRSFKRGEKTAAAYENILQSNAVVLTSHKFSKSRNLLLVLDSLFPPVRSGTSLLQSGIHEWWQEKPIIMPTAIVLGIHIAKLKYLHSSLRGVTSTFTTSLIIFFDLNNNLDALLVDKKLIKSGTKVGLG